MRFILININKNYAAINPFGVETKICRTTGSSLIADDLPLFFLFCQDSSSHSIDWKTV